VNKFIFSDILAIKNKGVEYLEKSEIWPVSEEEFQGLSVYMYQQYEKLMFELEDNLFDIALIDYKFPALLLQIFHYNYMKNYAQTNNIDILYGGNSQSYLYPNWHKIGRQYSLLKPCNNKLIRIIRRITKNIIFNKHLGFYELICNLLSGSGFVSIGSSSSLKQDFVLKKEIYCDHQDAYDLLDFDVDKKELVESYHQDIMDRLISPYLETIKSQYPLFLDGISISDIKSCWGNRFREMIPAYVNILNSGSKKNFLVTDVATIMNRMLVIGHQRIGREVFGFHHGGDFAATIINQIHKGAMTHCKNLVVPTAGIANHYKKTYAHLKLEVKVGTNYYSVKNFSKLLFNDKATLRSKKRIKTVMLMGFPMSCQRRIGERGLFFVQKINIEYDILTMLRKLGLNVLYKAHPDRKNEVDGLFDNIADKVIYDAFENSWKEADAFIFTYTSTTTFAFALETNRRVVLIDVDTNIVDKGLRQELGKRVDYVPATITDSNNLIKFDKRKLKECLLL